MKKKYLMLLLLLSGFPFAAQLWAQDSLNVDFVGVDSSLNGQDLTLYLRDPLTGEFLDSVMLNPVDSTDFTLSFVSVSPGSYYLDFFTDVNGNGVYDASPVDNSWRIMLDSIQGDTTIVWNYDTNYVDLTWETDTSDSDVDSLEISLTFTAMDPHLGQDFFVYLRDAESSEILDSMEFTPIDTVEFDVVFDSVMADMDYNVDFWADMNENGTYDPPPTDHAWRIELMNLMADTMLTFQHNTDFTDIFEDSDTTGTDTSNYQLTINFTGFADNVGLDFIIYLRDPSNNSIVDSVYVSPLDSADFTVEFDSVEMNNNYNLDFYSDANSSGSYDVPPTDQAWRIQLVNIEADTTITFMFDTNYTDIGLMQTGVDRVDGEADFSAYPNPVQDELSVTLIRGGTGLSIYNVTGALVMHRSLTPSDRLVKLNVSALKPGMYVLRLNTVSGSSQQKFLKE